MVERSTHLHEEFHGPQGWCMSFVQTPTMAADCCSVGHATIDKLTDDELLEIFNFYSEEDDDEDEDEEIDKWHTLVHVCQRWRNIVFASPHRLNLQLLCTNNKPVRAMLDIWPVLPLVIKYTRANTSQMQDADNFIAALEHHDRVRGILLDHVPTPVWETLAAEMQVPFPELTTLFLWSEDRSVPVLPDSFLGGYTPRLKTLSLLGIPFPAMGNLLLSASDLVHLDLSRLPHSGYISPETMVARLSSLNRLKSLTLGFQSPRSRPDQPSPPPQTRVVLPALIRLQFKGMIDYSEDFLARIDPPYSMISTWILHGPRL
ncbi:hypothetical protein BC826DRAFT_119768 [Russula brevipes]|nr:hypothetical protein BC826DRAFT_119768 [Russula brevipes]